ncbi:MAG: penicillin acylase family protein [Myxococcota bacterium]|nr:penicillin acylase family protein [Myxococcota bacterium]
MRGGRWGVLVLVGAGLALTIAGIERGRTRLAERGAFPQHAGGLSVTGIAEPVELVRDAHGVPHVLAASEMDAWFGLGFAHAQDRLAQMLWLVRLARGTTAEVVGPSGLEADRLARTLGLGRIADAEWEQLGARTRGVLEAYAAGVNARLERLGSGGVEPPVTAAQVELPLDAWRPADSLAVLKLHAWGLSGSIDTSLVLHDLLKRLGGVEARPFFPRSRLGKPLPPGDRPPLTAGPAAPPWTDSLRRAVGLAGASAGSTAWVVGGAHTASGLPVLGADVHLEPTVPLLLHVAHVRGGSVDVAGAMIPGIPIVWTGHNGRVAWGSTHARAAVTDLYSERLAEQEGEPRDHYHTGRRWRPLEVRVETIEVRGAEPERLSVRSTRHGPILDRSAGGTEQFAVAWVGAGARGGATLAALLAAARAPDSGHFRAALAGVSTPALAVVFADVAGAGGLQVAGWIPQRPLASELVPVPGRAPWYDWEGPIPFEKLPRATLGEGVPFVVAADNRLRTRGARRGEWFWRPGVRAARLEALLGAALADAAFDLADAEVVQADVAEPRGRVLVDVALALADFEELGSEAREVMGLLRGWDGEAGAESVGAAAYHAFIEALAGALFAERLGEDLFRRWLAVPYADPAGVVYAVVLGAGDSDAWSDRDTVSAAVAVALRDAWLELASRLGASRRKWVWGRLHQLSFRPFIPAPGASPLGPLAAGGSGDTVATAEYAPDAPFDVRIASLFRLVADVGSLEEVRVLLAPGPSEHLGHPDFGAGLDGWRLGRGASLGLEPAVRTRLVLEPRS